MDCALCAHWRFWQVALGSPTDSECRDYTGPAAPSGSKESPTKFRFCRRSMFQARFGFGLEPEAKSWRIDSIHAREPPVFQRFFKINQNALQDPLGLWLQTYYTVRNRCGCTTSILVFRGVAKRPAGSQTDCGLSRCKCGMSSRANTSTTKR
jgi:hypothetical protein